LAPTPTASSGAYFRSLSLSRRKLKSKQRSSTRERELKRLGLFFFCSTPKELSSTFFDLLSPYFSEIQKIQQQKNFFLLIRYVEAEKTNARWAMIGVAGILGQEILGVEPKWFLHGQKDYGKNLLLFFLSSSSLCDGRRPLPFCYVPPPVFLAFSSFFALGFSRPQKKESENQGSASEGKHEGGAKASRAKTDPFSPLPKKPRPPPTTPSRTGIPFLGLFAIQQIVFGFLETSRYQAWKSGEKNALFPLDPAGMNSDANAVKEIKNGRLAMVAFVGFAVQALVTREGPIEGLFGHLASPFSHNIIGNIANLPNVIGK
jgi:hypothetical protein